ncbi:MHYT domain-containing protein [Actinokineospora guangxiensis]|uniref:MHYT domain-containing protein n=1 Tax=Actinokineospora guangxiensis TaxID=1490288 RepID=A0ABW0EXX2_9PSEU
MGHINHFSSGAITPFLAYALSCLGCALGLLSMQRARLHRGGARWSWIALGAVSIGGTGIWVMHFVAMLGFSVSGTVVRYDVIVTLISLVVAVGIVWLGLSAVVFSRSGWGSLVGAGFITGSGVATMHYLGISAMNMHAEVSYDLLLLVLSIVIAVIASTAALWAALNIIGIVATIGAALVMGLAVSGMHYTGMAAMHVNVVGGTAQALHGVEAYDFFVPLTLVIAVVTALTLLGVAVSPNGEEIKEDQWADSELEKLMNRRR